MLETPRKRFVSYVDGGFPQPALFGRGVITANDEHTPETGMLSFEVDIDTLPHGPDDEFYQVTAAGVIEAKPQAEIDVILLERGKPSLRAHARNVMRGQSATLAPDFGDGDAVSASAYVLSMATARLNRRAKGQGQPQENALLDSLEVLQDAFELILSDIDSGTITTTTEIDSDPRWP